MFFVIYPSTKHLPEDGHSRWAKHLGGLDVTA